MRLSRRARRFLVLLHVLSAVSWLGVDLVIGVLSFTGLTTDDPRRMAVAYTGLSMFAVPLLLTVGLLCLVTGLLLGLGTRFGLLRYWWVVVKLALNLVLTTLVSGSALLFAAWLGVYKPWGPTRYGRRPAALTTIAHGERVR